MRWRHSRKGIIEGEVVEERSSQEALAIRLTNTVHGLAGSWHPGEVLVVRRAFVRLMAPVDVGPDTPRFRPPDRNGEPAEQGTGPDAIEEMEGPEDELPPEAA